MVLPSVTVTVSMALSSLRRCEDRVTKGPEYRPSQHALAQHVGDFVVSPMTVHVCGGTCWGNRLWQGRSHFLISFIPLTVGQPRRQKALQAFSAPTRSTSSTSGTSLAQYRCRQAKQANSKRRVGVTTAAYRSSFCQAPRDVLCP
jgi:hypothetical protein